MTHDEKWTRIHAIVSRLHHLDAEWNALVHEHHDLLKRVRERPATKRMTWDQADEFQRKAVALNDGTRSHREIGELIGLSRSQVTYLLSTRSKNHEPKHTHVGNSFTDNVIIDHRTNAFPNGSANGQSNTGGTNGSPHH